MPRMRFFLLGLALALLLGAGSLPHPVSADPAITPTIIDNGDTSQSAAVTAGGGNPKVASNADVASVLGGERDIFIQRTLGSARIDVDADSSLPSSLSIAQGSATRGIVTFTYDGVDGSATTLNPIGLDPANAGAVNLPATGQYAFGVAIISEDLGVNGIVRVYSSATACSELTRPLPSTLSTGPVVVLYRFSDFTTICSGFATLANFADVGAIQLVIDGTINADADTTLDYFSAISLDYGDLPANTVAETTSGTAAAHADDGTLRLGTLFDTELNGTLDPDAVGDDSNSATDDEDGVTTPSPWTATGGSVTVQVSGANSCLMGWIDTDRDGTLTDETPFINNVAVTPGSASYPFTFNPPISSFPATNIPARYRLYPRDADDSCDSIKTLTNAASGGEVEDYLYDFSQVNEPPADVALAGFEATMAGTHVLVRWETASERGNTGFNLYRSESPASASRVQLNANLIPSQAPGGTTGFAYEYADHDVTPGTTYYYWIEDVDVNGVPHLHGPTSITFTVPTAVTIDRLVALPNAFAPVSLALAVLGAIGMVGWAVRRRA